ncbi:MAG TPA: hypothetical protein PKL56_16910 [Cyclobacteriaceae bacterium]|nr:hypothetical protein [Cyclobacteriaceae bacterium]HMV09308.1 hypothetical protein [Cyclobacteriaceae bacterium]HMX01891.1 hypothetical protein [Cyclobacteriaceae bacterium]HMX50815.1 hypothetical protein [Cyclobacteriaceae bacterium]HMY94715.1 hypothetical protein [Cyclobacteriaceae bacterium]
MKTTTGISLLDHVIGQAFRIKGRAIEINCEIIRLFSNSRFNYFLQKHPNRDFINLELIPRSIRDELKLTDHDVDELFPGVRKKTITKAKLPFDEVRHDIELALQHSSRYHSNFFEIKDTATIELKARTLAVMSVVVRVIRETGDYQLLYSVLKTVDVRTEIPLGSGKEFYQYARDVFDFGLSKLNP